MSTGVGNAQRLDAVRAINARMPRKIELPADESGRPLKTSEYYGINTFGLVRMKEKLPKDIFARLTTAIHSGGKIDREVATAVAHSVKEWALSQGVTHFCHWFQPLTGATAEKHDAFLSFDDAGHVIEHFSGSQLIQSEPDASSFPSGGMRTTFEARGYTAWDPTSPMFIMEGVNTKTLCIPSVFISYHGHSLDEKTGLLRSMEALSKSATELLHTLGDKDVKRVVPTLGAEQEYFLVDRNWFSARPDLVMTGRTLLGRGPSRGQQLEDHYFGSIPTRVLAFMSEVETELFKLGVPIKTRHNEVAPSQFETAPIFEEANVATDHNQIVMELMRKVALRHNYQCLFHEKPFAGINGSGKHCNFSMQITGGGSLDGENLLEPGKTPHQNLRFLVFLVAVMKGVYKHSALLRAGIATHGNDHRLGANEAPPAIISVFLGEELTRIVSALGAGKDVGESAERVMIHMGVSKLPEVAKDNTDRNRTSPFAFTGNKFEFRAVGSSAPTGFAMTFLHAAVAEGILEVNAAIQAKVKAGKSVDAAALEVIREGSKETEPVRFEGNGYSEDWQKEAAKRGLPNHRTSPDAMAALKDRKSIELFKRLGIFGEEEVMSRYHIRLERYIKHLLIEVNSLREMVDTLVLPACFLYHRSLSEGAAAAKAAGVSAPQLHTLKLVGEWLGTVGEKRKDLDSVLTKVEKAGGEEAQAKILAAEMVPAMLALREACDELEALVGDEYWPLPKYREMLFV
ncbi:MAG: glutamine synthetase III [Bdellovibrionales bacterium]|nr:glutamine synthetase III [Bdellovibrionales bacterium]